jgi:cation:H+ antiporter
VVSVDAAVQGRPDIAVGNVVGSNIGNVLLILGICAFITPLAVKPLALRRDALTVVAASGLFAVLAADGGLSRIDALISVTALVAYLVWAYRSERYSGAPSGPVHQAEGEELTALPPSAGLMVVAIIGGLGLLIGGSQVLLWGAIGIAEAFAVPEAVIGLTLVAVGTSLPELSISVIAAVRRHGDVAVGNVLGSNIFNVLGILGVSALLQPLPVTGRIQAFDQWVLVGTALLLLPLLYSGRRITRWEGGTLLLGYIGYLVLGFRVFGG